MSGVPRPRIHAVGERCLDQGVVVGPAPPRRRELTVDDLDREPFGHAVTVGRPADEVQSPQTSSPGETPVTGAPTWSAHADGDQTGGVSVQLRVALAQVDTRVGDLPGQQPSW